MKFKAVKGTRDFYPDRMRVRNYIVDAWRRVSGRNGFEEYDAPIFEHLELFTVKSGEEIASQLFSFTDRGGRSLAVRPEITPSLARMVAAKINSMPRPIKWFSVPRLCRAEAPQRGRLREFFQWNIDIIDEDDVQADAECVYVLADFFREVGLTPEMVQIRVGSRPIVTSFLSSHGVHEKDMEKALSAVDKRTRVSQEVFAEMMAGAGVGPGGTEAIIEFVDTPPEKAAEELSKTAETEGHSAQLLRLMDSICAMGVSDYISIDFNIVRGLAYYTGIVYEAIAPGERAVAGGGRYDGLLEVVGGPPVPATGFGMGDVVLGIMLQENGLLPEGLEAASLDYFIIDADGNSRRQALELVDRLRAKGISADYSMRAARTGRQMKEADRRNARFCALAEAGFVSVKDMSSGEQTARETAEEFLSRAGKGR